MLRFPATFLCVYVPWFNIPFSSSFVRSIGRLCFHLKKKRNEKLQTWTKTRWDYPNEFGEQEWKNAFDHSRHQTVSENSWKSKRNTISRCFAFTQMKIKRKRMWKKFLHFKTHLVEIMLNCNGKNARTAKRNQSQFCRIQRSKLQLANEYNGMHIAHYTHTRFWYKNGW